MKTDASRDVAIAVTSALGDCLRPGKIDARASERTKVRVGEDGKHWPVPAVQQRTKMGKMLSHLMITRMHHLTGRLPSRFNFGAWAGPCAGCASRHPSQQRPCWQRNALHHPHPPDRQPCPTSSQFRCAPVRPSSRLQLFLILTDISDPAALSCFSDPSLRGLRRHLKFGCDPASTRARRHRQR